MLKACCAFGNTLCSDGAKHNKRSALNTVLVSVGGTPSVQSTDATTVPKKNAEYLLGDIDKAVEKVGVENVFLVCMDGTCKGTLKWIDTMYQQNFPNDVQHMVIRCCTKTSHNSLVQETLKQSIGHCAP